MSRASADYSASDLLGVGAKGGAKYGTAEHQRHDDAGLPQPSDEARSTPNGRCHSGSQPPVGRAASVIARLVGGVPSSSKNRKRVACIKCCQNAPVRLPTSAILCRSAQVKMIQARRASGHGRYRAQSHQGRGDPRVRPEADEMSHEPGMRIP
jgi:hypothetical protein